MYKVLIGGNSFTLTNEAIREIHKAGWEVCFAKTYDEIKMALKHQSQIMAVIIDNDLPVFIFRNQEIQSFEISPPKPLWILTAQKDHLVALTRALQAGFDEFLSKPVGMDEIKALLNKYSLINK